jgi:hypothetical protein
MKLFLNNSNIYFEKFTNNLFIFDYSSEVHLLNLSIKILVKKSELHAS